MATTKLEVYNSALVLLKERTLASLSEARTERRTLDRVWNQTVAYMLEGGLWNFATRTDEWQPSDTQTSEFGYLYVYEKPEDYVRLIKIADNDRLRPTLSDFSEEGDVILSDCSPMYVSYVSNGNTYGGDVGKWSPSFATALVDELAYRAAPQIASIGLDMRDWLEKKRRRSMAAAKGKDAVNQPTSELPFGRLMRSRHRSSQDSRMQKPRI